ncbi:MAG TPA: MFS transporter [Candidatus Limnocylindria bacterium]
MLPAGTRSRGVPVRVSFWLLAVMLAACLFAASAPSALYAVWAARFHFPPSTLTEIYAVYAFGALVALLITGRLSDHIGRRRVVVIALVIQVAGVLSFVAARGVGELFIGRTLQGIGTGVASGAISAWLLDLQPRDDQRRGGLVGGIAPIAGLGTGALVAGLLVEYGPDPQHLVFSLLAGFFALALVVAFAIPDVAPPRAGWLRSLRPELGVPPAARGAFIASVPSIVAIWALGGLYLSLGPSLATSLLDSDSRVAGGAVVAALLGTGAVASAVVASRDARTVVKRASLLLIVGVAVTLVAVAVRSPAFLYAGSVLAGLGHGPAFSALFRSLAPLAPADKRGGLVAAIYVVLYLSFSIPAIVAGVAVGAFGLRDTTYAYGAAVIALAAVTILAGSHGERRAAIPRPGT